jgi:DNA-binding NtrC family response regulator
MESRGRRKKAGPQQTRPAPLGGARDNSTDVKWLLAIHDDPVAAQLIIRIANKCGYLGRALSDTRNIRSVLREWQPEVLTLDLCMPEDDGFQILSVLQSVGFNGQVVIISGKDQWMRKAACDLAEVREINIVTHLQKPIDVQGFRDLLMTL